MQIVINVDWDEEFLSLEEQAGTLEDLVQLAVEKGLTTPQIARLHIVQRERGEAEDGVIADNKTLFQNGATSGVDLAFNRLWVEIELNGKKNRVRQLVGDQGRETQDDDPDESTMEFAVGEDDGKSWYKLGSNGARENAEHYIDKVIPGHIWGRLLVLHESEGNPIEAIDRLHQCLDGMRDEFDELEPPQA
jgi:hypothetical protein